MYDAAIGRWHVQDPLTDFMPGITSYNYCYNNPVSLIDVDGLYADRDDDNQKRRKKRRANRRSNKEPRKYRPARGSRGRNGRKSKGNVSGPIQGLVTGYLDPGKPYEEISVKEPGFDLEDETIDFGEDEPINTQEEYYNYLERKLTARPRNLTGSFGSTRGNHDAYISNGEDAFYKYLEELTELINNRPNIKVKVIVTTGYEKDANKTFFRDPINIFTAPGIKIEGTSNQLLNIRKNNLISALTGSGVPSSIISSKETYSENNSVFIKVYK